MAVAKIETMGGVLTESRPRPSFIQSPVPSADPSHPRLPHTISLSTSPVTRTSRFDLTIPFDKATTNSLPYPSPLPLLSLAPAQVASLRGQLLRRRSSYPPVTTPGSSAGFAWNLGGTPAAKSIELQSDIDTRSFGNEVSSGLGMGDQWDALLSFDPSPRQTPLKLNAKVLDRSSTCSPKPPTTLIMGRARSEPGEPKGTKLLQAARIAQTGSDLAWKTILSSVVEVEGVGEVGVCKVLQEVWKRGGGEAVTSQCLWPGVIVSLRLSSDATGRTAPPSAQAAMALQGLYNLTLKHWEPSIFSGLLASYAGSVTPTESAPPIDFPPVSAPKYGASTPTKEFDQSLAQWTNLTPGLGGDFSALFGTGSTPKASVTLPSNLGQFEFHPEHDSLNNTSFNEVVGGIDEILASMEKDQEEGEKLIVRAAASAHATPTTTLLPLTKMGPQDRTTVAFQLPTPETDSDNANDTPKRQSISQPSQHFSPESMASPFATASSSTTGTTSQVSKELNPPTVPVATGSRAAHPKSLTMPTEAFVPPPPMCMFFNPSFRDLQKGKVGVWKGDLVLKGKGGDTFNILIVGEEVSGHLWQSHLWSSTLTYPLDNSVDNDLSSFTSKMIPVAYLAREGFTPVTMGMVLCNDANIQAYVAMVQHLHAEGVAFHLPNSANLPIVCLPAKFDPNDPLQRLGIAYMTKPGAPIPLAPKNLAPRPNDEEAESGTKRKRRRQSMPAKPTANGSVSRRRESVVASFRAGLRGSKVEEHAILEEKG